MQSPDIYQYLDYREFVKAHCLFRQKSDKKFSYRYLARHLGLKSPDYLSMILDGSRNLRTTQSSKLARMCGLKGRQGSYFHALVEFNQAKDPNSKEILWARVLEYAPIPTHILSDENIQIFHHWYLIALYEATNLVTFKNDPKWIVSKFNNLLSLKEVVEGLQTLKNLGLITEVHGRLVRNKGNVFGGGIPSEVIRSYHLQYLDLAKTSLVNEVFERRVFLNTTLSIPEKSYPSFCERLEQFQADVMKLATLQDDSQTDAVYQLSMQFFPLTRKES